MKIKNSNEIDAWLWEHSAVQGHLCNAKKGPLLGVQPGEDPAEEFNLKWVDTVTGEEIDVIYDSASLAQPAQESSASAVELLAGMKEIYEIWAGSEGFVPQTAPEAYQQHLLLQIKDVAARFINPTHQIEGGE